MLIVDMADWITYEVLFYGTQAKIEGRHATFLETIHLSVPLPKDELYCPMVNVRVFDDRLMGKALVGSTSIPLIDYLPWNE